MTMTKTIAALVTAALLAVSGLVSASGPRFGGHYHYSHAYRHEAVHYHYHHGHTYHYRTYDYHWHGWHHRCWYAARGCWLYWVPDAGCWYSYTPADQCYVPCEDLTDVNLPGLTAGPPG
jgi:hypothetical protein